LSILSHGMSVDVIATGMIEQLRDLHAIGNPPLGAWSQPSHSRRRFVSLVDHCRFLLSTFCLLLLNLPSSEPGFRANASQRRCRRPLRPPRSRPALTVTDPIFGPAGSPCRAAIDAMAITPSNDDRAAICLSRSVEGPSDRIQHVDPTAATVRPP